MKKLLIIILALSVLLVSCAALAACEWGGQTETSDTDATTVETESTGTEAPTTKPSESQATESTDAPETTESDTSGGGTEESDTEGDIANGKYLFVIKTDSPRRIWETNRERAALMARLRQGG